MENNIHTMDVHDLGHLLTIASGDVYEKVLDKFANKMTSKFLTNSSDEEKELFKKRLKESQVEKMKEKLTLIMNRVLTDQHFIHSCDVTMKRFKTLEQLKEDIEIANNHLQSVENERSILYRDTDMAIDKVEKLCEGILEHNNC